MNLLQLWQHRFQDALSGLATDPAPYAAMVKPAQDARFGDYQANCAMSLAKVLGRKPREVAQEIVQRLKVDDVAEPPEVAGPGFINLRLRTDWLAGQVQNMARGDRLGLDLPRPARTLVIDFSSPNVAKPMHVGHLRSTIIGDSLARLFRFLGHQVSTDNHLGDWGTQFGMLLYGYKHFRDDQALTNDPVREMVRLYKMVQQKIAEEEKAGSQPVTEAARRETAQLHGGDPENVALWKEFMPWCLEEIDRIYRRLDVHFDYTLGESSYNPMLPEVVQDLLQHGIAQRGEEGAVALFFGEGESKTVAVIQKGDGAFTYTTTDLATIQYRMERWKPDAILYVVDSRQALHFKNLFEAARRWGYDRVALEHVSFGSVLGPNGKPLKTRTGENVELSQLLDEAVVHGREVYEQLRQERIARGQEVPDLSEEERCQVAEVVGLGAVKYADLSQNRTSDYVFSWDKMLDLKGNTSAYMQYAYVRVRGIFRKGEEDPQRFRARPSRPYLEQPQERALALQLLRLGEALEAAAAEYKPNLITAYLWDLARAYSGFFENCPVLTADTPMRRESRLLLSDLTARVIQQGLQLLGIRTVERM
ncbi:MAG: arginine--tRNA ligase [Planctomycetes bacterium]|nr:arginine--tRNA ligase [Planctomycetota bacterium]